MQEGSVNHIIFQKFACGLSSVCLGNPAALTLTGVILVIRQERKNSPKSQAQEKEHKDKRYVCGISCVIHNSLRLMISFGARFRNAKTVQRVGFGAGYPVDVHADIPADVRGQKLRLEILEKQACRCRRPQPEGADVHDRGGTSRVFGKPCFCPLPKRGCFDENGKSDEFTFYPLKTRASLLKPPKTTRMIQKTGFVLP